ncbi:PIN domain-containing protein [Salinibius halmophilus]|uniref:PIN domain-containing protein n=1 Tax=Salinibius halmophilus TaxID=1853216 RepID=UPI000E665023|nr:PIN domain-containing protein [Salinibius halmophilus]
MSSNYTLVYDACVMYLAPLRSLLMYLALSGQFRARWSEAIHDEWIRNLLKNRPDLSQAQLDKVRALMNRHVPGCLVEGYESLVPSVELPDPDDRHVVAAAVQTRAEAIVTFNLKDFPEGSLAKYNLKAIHPDDFISDLIELNFGVVLDAVRKHRSAMKNPPFTADEYLDLLLKQRLPETVSKLRPLTLMI